MCVGAAHTGVCRVRVRELCGNSDRKLFVSLFRQRDAVKQCVRSSHCCFLACRLGDNQWPPEAHVKASWDLMDSELPLPLNGTNLEYEPPGLALS